MRPEGWKKLKARKAEPEVGFLRRGRCASFHDIGLYEVWGNNLAQALPVGPGAKPRALRVMCILGSSGGSQQITWQIIVATVSTLWGRVPPLPRGSDALVCSLGSVVVRASD